MDGCDFRPTQEEKPDGDPLPFPITGGHGISCALWFKIRLAMAAKIKLYSEALPIVWNTIDELLYADAKKTITLTSNHSHINVSRLTLH